MSYGIIRIQKYSKGSVKGIQIHDQREKDFSHSNLDIDFSKSELNYDLMNSDKINYTQKVNDRINELNLKRAVRKDAIIMCQCLITSDKSFFENMNLEEQKMFFKKSFYFISERYGKENIVSATVHLDEATPHLHINFVPVTSDGRLCAKDLFKKKDLSKLHDDFFEFNKINGYDLKRGEKKEEIQKYLSTEEFKIKISKENIEKDKQELDKIQNAIKDYLKAHRTSLNDLMILNTINAKKTFLGDNMMLKTDEYNNLVYMAKESIVLKDIQDRYISLKNDYDKLKNKVELGLNERIRYSTEISDLKNKLRNSKDKFSDLLNERNSFVDFINDKELGKDYYNFIEQREMEKQKNKSKDNDWDLEL